MIRLARPRRPRRSGEWTEAAAVNFIVRLAASGSVSLAAAAVGISRQSAYALRGRDPAFAASWDAALAARRPVRVRPAQLDGSDTSDNPPVAKHQPDIAAERDRLAEASARRDTFFAGLARSAPLA